mgnify:CR=1 FL=1
MPPKEKKGLFPPLRLIKGVEREEVEVALPVNRRPGDHLELITMTGAAFGGIRRVALACGISGETGVALVLERALVRQQFRRLGRDNLITLLDSIARCAGARVALWEANGAYLRHLRGSLPTSTPARPFDSPRVAVPLRLHERLARNKPPIVDEPECELQDAIAWEVAALLAGETLCEWAYRSALDLCLD